MLAPCRYRWGVAASVEIAPIGAEEYEELLPLIAAYQRFYEVEQIDEERNRRFFKRFLAPSQAGLLLGARAEGRLLGYACLYWHFSSLAADEAVLMNDLFVAAEARERGAGHLEWSTAPGNRTAQRLYDTTGAARSEWIAYELGL
jgi:hypothetical protein